MTPHQKDRLEHLTGEPTKAYIVTVPLRGTRNVLIYADSAREAVYAVSQGYGDAIDSEIWRVGNGTARREPGSDGRQL